MYTVRSSVSDIGKEAGWQLTLDIDVPLLNIPILRIGVRRERRRTVCRYIARESGRLRWERAASGRRQNPLRAEWAACVGTTEIRKGASSGYICEGAIVT